MDLIAKRVTLPLNIREQRSQSHKNWGHLQPIRFRKGIPQYFLFSSLLVFLILLLLSLCFSIHRKDFGLILSGLVAIWSLIRVLSIDPGNKADPTPFIETGFIQGYANFCSVCLIFKGPKEYHCQQCNVCYQNAVCHSNVMGVCITDSNLNAIIQMALTMGLHLGICAYVNW